MRENIKESSGTKIFFEVPNALDTFQNLAIWDIIYEHCCYFTAISLSNAFSSCGFRVTATREEYRGQFLCLEAVPSINTQDLRISQAETLSKLKDNIVSFNTKFQQKVTFWKNKLQEIAHKNQRVVLWGAGSKGVNFLNILKEQQQIEYVVDINPHKEGKYIPGTGQKIMSPEFLLDYQPDLVIIMNPIYESEICKMLENIGVVSEYITSV